MKTFLGRFAIAIGRGKMVRQRSATSSSRLHSTGKDSDLTGRVHIPNLRLGELAIHRREYKLFEAAQILRHDLSALLNTASDGWVPLEDWASTESAHQELFDGMMHAVLVNENPDPDEPVKDLKTLRPIWPFDLEN